MSTVSHKGEEEARLTCSGEAALQRGEEWKQQQLLGQAGPLLRQQVEGPDGHALVLRASQLISEVQQLKYLQLQVQERTNS